MFTRKRPAKTIKILIFILIILIPRISCTHDSELFKTSSSASLNIESIKGGYGITFSITNKGTIDLTNLRISSTYSDGLFIRLFQPNASLSPIPTNQTITYRLNLCGIGLGKITNLPIVHIMVNSDQASDTVHIKIRLIGPFTKIIGIVHDNQSSPGYILFSPEYSTKSYLIDKNGSILHTWQSSTIQSMGIALLENGDLLRSTLPYPNPRFISGGVTGRVEQYSWNNSLQWSFTYSNMSHCLHHDITILPNGNVLMIAWEYKSMAEAIQAGRDPVALPYNELWPDQIIEVQPTPPEGGIIVWEWHLWDHLIQDFDPEKTNYGVVADHPELLDINYGKEDGRQTADWNHINSIDYHPELDQILISSHNQHEIWIIDHSTTTEEAAGHTGGRYGHGGDFLYRWGNPRTYQRGTINDKRLFGQHDAQWINPSMPGEGNILLFNNGEGRPEGQYSTVDELSPPVNPNGSYSLPPNSPYGPDHLIWQYQASNPFEFFCAYLSGAQRLENGNTLITDGDHGLLLEVTPLGIIVWQYRNPFPNLVHNQLFHALFYSSQHPVL